MESGGSRRSAQFDPGATVTHKPVIHPNLASKNERILRRIIEKLGEGEYRISSRGVPHAVFRDYYSVVRFGSGKLAVFDNYGYKGPQTKTPFPHWNAVVEYLKDKLNP